jgi:hypothetical protein
VKNHPHSDYGDALCYLLTAMSPGKGDQPPRKPTAARTAFNPLRHNWPSKHPGVGVLIPSRLR